jgi:glutamine synthetase type III
VFSEEVAMARLPKPIFKALQKTIRKGCRWTPPSPMPLPPP